MPDFSTLKKELDFRLAAERRAILAQERERSLRERAAQLKRSAGDNNQDTWREIEKLRERADTAAANYQAALSDRTQSRARLNDIWATLLPLTDPREHIQQWSDDWPVLLFPVRVETRFKRVTNAEGRPGDELWVRIYPDDCLIDTFEADLTQMEQQNARRFWAFYWAAAGNEEQERRAWRDLVTAHGSGRAGWIIEHYAPLNPSDRPASPPPPNTFYLTIPVADTEPLGTDAGAVADFWRAVYLGTKIAADASDLARRYPPANLREAAPEGATIQVVYLRFPAFAEAAAKPFSWSQAPQARLLPERFVFLGYRYVEGKLELVQEAITARPVQAPLSVGPNPTAPEAEQFQETEEGDLLIPEEMQWMTDFGAALDKGMALRIPLTDTLGFDRVLILGLRLGSDPVEAKGELTELLRHHLYGRSGLSLVPQGTPTNNTDEGPAGYQRTDDPDESFPVFVKQQRLYAPTTDPTRKTDGQRLAEWLGLDHELMQRIPNADQTDGAEAQAMNTALWPATLGYWMQKMMDPIFRNETIVAQTRDFFLRYVSGRGALSAIRIGKQPYGILPTCAYRQISWPGFDNPVVGTRSGPTPFLPRLHRFLRDLDDFWRQMSTSVPYVGRSSSDPQQQLLDIVGLHPNSAEYHARLGHSRSFYHNYLSYAGLLPSKITTLEPTTDELLAEAKKLLTAFGYKGATEPKIFEKYYRTGQNRLNGPIIDDQPLSEVALIRPYTTDGKNYLAWLAAAVDDYEGQLLPQKGFADRPKALLYLLLRHALLEAYGNAGHGARFEAALTDANTYREALANEPDYIHVAAATTTSESRFAHLLANEPALGNADVSLAKYLGMSLREEVPPLVANAELRQMQASLAYLTNLPTARLERLLAEHIDCCTYRHDAWMQGIVHERLERKRARLRGEGGAATGLYLGAFAWLEALRPENKIFTPVQLSEDLAGIFQRPDDAPLSTDTTNQGYIHAPSLNHAVTAAVLRNGYLSNATPSQPELMAVNLSSERVRLALDTLEGIRNGQSLGALLGYRFERKLHDKDPALFVFSYQLRRQFPLVANRLEATKETDPTAQEAIAARNVVDGYALLKAALGPTNQLNFGFLSPVLVDPAPTAPQRTFIEESIRDLLDIYDALSDLGLSESVHQIVQGNYERAASTLDAYSKATFPQTPDVVVTPRSGLGLTHRVALHIDGNATAPAGAPPRERAEPGLAAWLSGILPPLSTVGVRVSYTNPGTPQPPPVSLTVVLADAGLRALDLLYLPDLDPTQALGLLEEWLLRTVFNLPGVHANATVRILYTEPLNDSAVPITYFELAPLLRSLRALVLNGRPLQPTDAMPPGESGRDREPSLVLERNRIAQALPDLTSLNTRITAWNAAFPPVDQQVTEFATVLNELGRYGLPEAHFGFAYQERQAIYTSVLDKLREYLTRWADRRLEFDTLLAEDLPAAADAAAAHQVLRQAEALVSTDFITPVPPLLLDYQNAVIAKGNAFSLRQLALTNVLNNPPSPLEQFLNDLRALLPLTIFDATDFSLDDADASVTRLQEDLLEKATTLRRVLQQRSDAANALLVDHDAVGATATQRLAALQAAARALFGDEFITVPYFQLPGPQGAEWQNSLAARAELLAHAERTDPLPIDTWLHGMARVRERLHHLENAYLLAEGFGRTPAELTPAQFPHRRWVPDPEGAPGVERAEPWLAVEYPATFQLKEEKLLYTAAYFAAFQPGGRQCGLLLDEWTEVIPTREETTGLAFHYDRPNTEAPQTLLLVAPSLDQGEWAWEDLIAALHQTLDAAKQRAVEPEQVEKTALGVYSPATVFPVTPWSLTPSLNLNWVNTAIGDA
ncbi:hypothetical protein [Neolewinella litorea]|uniref:Uncharacterized protein n=1 Tax=Neolewinella litorea TaxID=2562452 RepID=A0A4S4N8S9_9BACT|nr:hypothetical protein [Neolewinella litorea]THH35622.1 hypothetical protein E4021_16170 [Neolewinella litorea]